MKNIYVLLIISCQFILVNRIKASDGKAHTNGSAGCADTAFKAEVSQWIKSIKGIRFIENKGQMADMQGKAVNSVLFKADGGGVDMYITTNGLSYVFTKMEKHKKTDVTALRYKAHGDNDSISEQYCRADMELAGADIRKENIIKEGESGDRADYYLGGICPNGIKDVHSYEKITIQNIYPGIDWVLYTGEKGLKYNFIIHPGADPSLIRLKYKWTDKPELEKDGSLRISTPMGNIAEGVPISYIGDKQNEIKTSYAIENNEIRFAIGKYNTNETLIIDPTLVWTTYYGGNGTCEILAIHDDGTSVWVTGEPTTTNLPTVNPGGGAYFQGIAAGWGNVLIMQFTTAGVLKWATYYGGTGGDEGWGIYSDGTNVWVTGESGSPNFPTLNPGGGAYYQAVNGSNGGGNAFILQFTTSGVLKWATLYGGTGDDAGYSIQSDGTNVWVTGWVSSTGFPTLNPGGGAYYQAANGGSENVFILQFNTLGVLKWATYYGGNGVNGDFGTSIYSDGTNVWVTGTTASANFPILNPGGGAYYQPIIGSTTDGTAFILQFTTTGIRKWATYYGGTGGGGWGDAGNSIFSDGTKVWVTGYTASANFPTQNLAGAYNQSVIGGRINAFILQFNTSGVCNWATYYGGNTIDKGYTIQNDGTSVWVCGSTQSSNFPTYNPGGCANFYQNTIGTISGGGTGEDVFLLQFNTSGVPKWATYYGVDGEDDGSYASSDGTNLFVTGDNMNQGYPVLNPGGGAYYSATTGSLEAPFFGEFCIPCSEPPTAITSSIPTGCNGATGSATVNASGNITPYTYLWKPGNQTTATITGLSAGNYTLTITGANGCGTDTAYATVSQPPGIYPSLSVRTNNPSICAGSSVILFATGSNITNGYTWQPGALSGDSVAVTPTVTSTYTVTGSNACGTADTTITINVTPLPVPAFNADIIAGCSPLCIQFHNMSAISSGKISSYGWDYGNRDSSNTQNPIYCYLHPGIYSVKITATSDSGCSATLVKQNYITVYTNPSAGFTISPQPTTFLEPTIQFTNNSTDAYGLAEWNWSFGDGSDSSSQTQNTSHTYHDTGTYCPTLLVTNIHGCVDSVINCLVIDPIFTLYIPSAFTPNGERNNQVFEAKGNDVKSFEMYIFDRWGMELFHSTAINNGWDGTFKNTICQEDAYVYVITAYDSNNNKHSYTGTVNLLK